MKFFIIRHKASGEIMPLMKRGRGYSHWNPNNKSNPSYKIYSLLDRPRLFESVRHANRAISGWVAFPNGRNSPSYDFETGYTEYDLHFKDDGRKKEDLEIVPVYIRVGKPIKNDT